MSNLSRRTVLAGAAMFTATAAAAAQDSSQPIVGKTGGTILGPRNLTLDGQNPDVIRPPTTDNGGLPNLRFSYADAHMKMREGGWSREITQTELPIATTIAGVNMRLNPGGVRELHWHKEAEWAFVLAGKARITAVDNDGHNFIADVDKGDLWYFPAGIPHSIQGLSPEGTEFLLAFPNGGFSEDNTFAITDMFAHFPIEALAKNFGVDQKTFDKIPSKERFIFQAPAPPSLQDDTVTGANGNIALSMVFKASQQTPQESSGGAVRIVDTRNFQISSDIAAAIVDVKPGHMREIHWHPNADEWQFFVSGKARMTVFAAQGNARTFDFNAGDVGYVPKSMPHFVENMGQEPLRFLELFRAPTYLDVSLKQWMALTPHELVQAHLNVDLSFLDGLSKAKLPIV
jgi:oxalate decarboxylase